MSARTGHDVVIAGAGPTGLMLAGELALAGVDVALLERRPGPELDGPRARGIQARTIEVLDQRGIADRFLAEGVVAQIAGFGDTRLDLVDVPTRHPYGLAIWQRDVERLLAGWVEELSVPIRRGCEVTGLAQDDAEVTVEIADGTAVRAGYLVGCDGGRSAVRAAAGIACDGWDPSTSYVIAEVEMRDEPEIGVRRDDRGVYALGRAEDGRVHAVIRDAQVESGTPTLPELGRALVDLYGTDFGLHRASWISRFTDATRQAAAYRDGRVLLAGDAAHVHTPMGGQGLNTGIQDAVNLGWKLALTVRGTAPAGLLDSYHAERHPVGARVQRTTMAMTALSRGDARTDALRDTVSDLLAMDEPRTRYAAMMAGLDVHYDLGAGHPLLGRRMPDVDLVATDGPLRMFELLRGAEPVLVDLAGSVGLDLAPWHGRVRRVDARHEGSWELPVVGRVSAPSAVLVRPDGHVAWVGEGTDAGPAAALTTWVGAGGTA